MADRRLVELFTPFRLAPADLLREATYRRLWISILISSLGGQVTLLALPLSAAVLLHAAPTQMGLLTAMEIVPFVVFSLPVGVWLDRVRKLPVYVVGELSIAVTVASVPLAWWLGRLTIGWLYFVAFVIGAVNTTAGSAAQIVLTQIVPRERLVEAHAKNALASSTAEVTGPGAAGALIKLIGAPTALLADAVLLLVSATILRGVPVRETPSKTNAPFWPAMREGVNFVRAHRLLLTMATCVGVLGNGPTLVLGFAVSGAGWLVLAIAPLNGFGVAAYACMLLSFGVGAVFIFINFLSLRQAVTPASMLGRMTSTMRWLILLPAGPGALLGGWLGEHLGLRVALGFSGSTAVLLSLVAGRLTVIRSVKTLPSLTTAVVSPIPRRPAAGSELRILGENITSND